MKNKLPIIILSTLIVISWVFYFLQSGIPTKTTYDDDYEGIQYGYVGYGKYITIIPEDEDPAFRELNIACAGAYVSNR